MASRQPVVPVRASMIATLVVAAWIVVGAPPSAVAKPPSCAVSNQGNHNDYGSLQAAVTAATPGDTLKIKGTCIGTTSVDRDITLRGVGNATLDGNAQGRVLRIGSGTTTIRDLTITNGKTSSLGGGIYVATAAVLDHVLVTGNEAGATQFGGGIEADLGSSLTLTHSTVSGNSAGSSGGIDMFQANASLTKSTVAGNRATRSPSTDPDGCAFGDLNLKYACAGGIWNYQGRLALIDSSVTGNTAAYRGGGIATYVRLFDNGAPRSGLTTLSGTSSISSNSAGDSGGGIFLVNPVADPMFGVRAADGTSTYTDPVSGATLRAWKGSVSGNAPDQCVPTLTLGSITCGP